MENIMLSKNWPSQKTEVNCLRGHLENEAKK